MKSTAVAPSNIAFIKYWGKKDKKLRLPENGSFSMNLSNLSTTTTVEFDPKFKKDTVVINNKRELKKTERVIKHLDRVRKLAKIDYWAKVVSENNFPTGTGLSSSSSGFAALSLAASKAAGLDLSKKELSILARQGSGSACRSIPDGFVEWLDGKSSQSSYSVSYKSSNYWDIIDIVAIVSQAEKDISSTKGQEYVNTSPFFKTRLANIKSKINKIKKLIDKKKFRQFGELIESEALELHAIMITSKPALIYWLPETLVVMKSVQKWRQKGLEVYFTINTGQDIHLICQSKDKDKVISRLKQIKQVNKIIINKPAKGAKIIKNHLF